MSASTHEVASLPDAKVEFDEAEGIHIDLQRIRPNTVIDQGSGLVSSDGCFSNPGGPAC